jgi:hypothetical protein
LQEIRRKSKVELEEIVPIKPKSLPKQYSSNRKFSIQTHSTNEEILKLKDLKKNEFDSNFISVFKNIG